jgi:hypothetical protein
MIVSVAGDVFAEMLASPAAVTWGAVVAPVTVAGVIVKSPQPVSRWRLPPAILSTALGDKVSSATIACEQASVVTVGDTVCESYDVGSVGATTGAAASWALATAWLVLSCCGGEVEVTCAVVVGVGHDTSASADVVTVHALVVVFPARSYATQQHRARPALVLGA